MDNLVTISILHSFGLEKGTKKKKIGRGEGEKKECFTDTFKLWYDGSAFNLFSDNLREEKYCKNELDNVCIACYTKGYYFSLHVYLPLEKF